MKTWLLFSIFILAVTAFGQTTMDAEIERIVRILPREIVKYTPPQKTGVLCLNTAFNNAVFADTKALNALNEKAIIKVELVYTTYRKSETFDQHGLNRKRLKALFTAAPNVLKQPGIEWVLLAQTGCQSAEQGPDYFHGVVVTYRDRPTDLLTEIEEQFMREAMAGKVPAYAYDTYVRNELEKATVDSTGKATAKEPVIKLPEFPQGSRARIDYFTRNLKFPGNAETGPQQVLVQFMIDKEGKIKNIQFPDVLTSTPYHDEVLRFVRSMPDWSPGAIDGKKTDCMVQFSVDFMSRGTVVASPMEVFAVDAPPTKTSKAVDYSKIKPNGSFKSIAETMARYNWNNTVLVCDVTGSMAPYNVQVMEILKNSFIKKDTAFRAVVYFNDGDNKSDKSKKVGAVGGVYVCQPTTFDEAFESLIKAMNAGNGGDVQENNVEALLKAEAACPTCTATVLIADNYASPRDMSLATGLTKPVRIIVCGTSPILNEQYLNLARITKGSVYFNNKEIKDIHLFEDGATVQVGKETYVLKGGKFFRR